MNLNLFDEEIPQHLVSHILALRLKNIPEEGRFNIYRPDGEFEKYFQQALDTTDQLVGIAEELRTELGLNDGMSATRMRFLSMIHKLLGPQSPMDVIRERFNLDRIKEDDIEARLPYLKCVNVINHVWGTASAIASNPMVRYDIYAFSAFNKYFLQATLDKYFGVEIPRELIDYYFKKCMDYIVHTNMKYGDGDDDTLTFGKCLDFFIKSLETKLGEHERISSYDNNEEFVNSVVFMNHDLPYVGMTTQMQMIFQTIFWYLLTNIKYKKLKRFLNESKFPLTADAFLECYTETLFENQRIFDEM